MSNSDGTIILEDAKMIWRNFAGREDQFNREGNRHFTVVLDDKTADQLQEDGWNVKIKTGKEDGDENINVLKVSVRFDVRPPQIFMITSRGRTKLDEDTCELLDDAELKIVDMMIRPYEWFFNGRGGRKAYLYSLYVTIEENYLDLKYANQV